MTHSLRLPPQAAARSILGGLICRVFVFYSLRHSARLPPQAAARSILGGLILLASVSYHMKHSVRLPPQAPARSILGGLILHVFLLYNLRHSENGLHEGKQAARGVTSGQTVTSGQGRWQAARGGDKRPGEVTSGPGG